MKKLLSIAIAVAQFGILAPMSSAASSDDYVYSYDAATVSEYEQTNPSTYGFTYDTSKIETPSYVNSKLSLNRPATLFKPKSNFTKSDVLFAIDFTKGVNTLNEPGYHVEFEISDVYNSYNYFRYTLYGINTEGQEVAITSLSEDRKYPGTYPNTSGIQVLDATNTFVGNEALYVANNLDENDGNEGVAGALRYIRIDVDFYNQVYSVWHIVRKDVNNAYSATEVSDAYLLCEDVPFVNKNIKKLTQLEAYPVNSVDNDGYVAVHNVNVSCYYPDPKEISTDAPLDPYGSEAPSEAPSEEPSDEPYDPYASEEPSIEPYDPYESSVPSIDPYESSAPSSYAPSSYAPSSIMPTESYDPYASLVPASIAPTESWAPSSYAPSSTFPGGSLAPQETPDPDSGLWTWSDYSSDSYLNNFGMTYNITPKSEELGTSYVCSSNGLTTFVEQVGTDYAIYQEYLSDSGVQFNGGQVIELGMKVVDAPNFDIELLEREVESDRTAVVKLNYYNGDLLMDYGAGGFERIPITGSDLKIVIKTYDNKTFDIDVNGTSYENLDWIYAINSVDGDDVYELEAYTFNMINFVFNETTPIGAGVELDYLRCFDTEDAYEEFLPREAFVKDKGFVKNGNDENQGYFYTLLFNSLLDDEEGVTIATMNYDTHEWKTYTIGSLPAIESAFSLQYIILAPGCTQIPYITGATCSTTNWEYMYNLEQ